MKQFRLRAPLKSNAVKNYPRADRVATRLQKSLSPIIQEHLRAESQSVLLTVTHIRLSPDLRSARVYVTCLGSKEANQLVHQLNTDAAKLRYQLAQSERVQMRMKNIPQLRFYLDEAAIQGQRTMELIDQLSETVIGDENDNNH